MHLFDQDLWSSSGISFELMAMSCVAQWTPPSKRRRCDAAHVDIDFEKVTPDEKIPAPRRLPPVVQQAVLDDMTVTVTMADMSADGAVNDLARILRPVWGDPLANYLARILIHEQSGPVALDLVDYLESRTEDEVYSILSMVTSPSTNYTENTARSVITEAILEV
jgi:hypothetical protein